MVNKKNKNNKKMQLSQARLCKEKEARNQMQ
jgi:hypothetical protein